MILRPVRPQSPTGPPMTNLPVGLMWNLVSLRQPFLRQHVLDHEFHHGFAQVFELHVRVVLGREHHGVEPGDLAVFVAAGDLGLRVRAQPRQQVVLADFGLALDEPVRVADRRRHQARRLVAGIAEHQALVAGALFFGVAAVDAHRDVGRLLADDVQHAAGAAVEADVRRGVADVGDDAADEVLEVDPGLRRDFAGDDRDAGLDQRFAGDARALVLRKHGVEHRVRNLVGDLVRVAFGDGFGGEQVTGRHE